MKHLAIEQSLTRAEQAKADSDFSYFFDLLLATEALTKTAILGIVAAIADDKDRNRYRLEHTLVRADGLGDWARVLEDSVTGAAAHYLLTEAYPEQAALTTLSRKGDWQYESICELKNSLNHLKIEAEDVPAKSDMKRWFRLFATLRNKTRAHGATKGSDVGPAAEYLRSSLDIFYTNFSLFTRPWAYLHRNLSGKYRISSVAGDTSVYDYLKSDSTIALQDGIYIWWGSPRRVPLLVSSPEVDDFFYSNGGFTDKYYELLSYRTDNKQRGNSVGYTAPPGTLPPSETDGHGELNARKNCFSNAPDVLKDYVARPELEQELLALLLDDRRPIVTLRGRGGIGKTSLALKVLESVYDSTRYTSVVWLSSRDVDLAMSGPKAVKPAVVGPEDMGRLYAQLVLSSTQRDAKSFNPRVFLEQQLHKCESGPTLFVFDNFETTQNPLEMFTWIDTYIRLPNKAILTTRLRDFKGDYPVEVSGMTYEESRSLIANTSVFLGISNKINNQYIEELIRQSEGHPYVIKILLGEVARTGQTNSIPHLVAGSDEVLTALFERTFAALSPCAQRAFLTLSSWNSSVPRLALEAILQRSTDERQEVESGIEQLLQYSLTEAFTAPVDEQEFLTLPLVANVFGRKKLNISPQRTAIQSDVELLQLLGPSRRDDIHLGMARKLEKFVSAIAKKVEAGQSYDDFESILEMICRSYPPGWLILARWHLESGSMSALTKAKHELSRFLESQPSGPEAVEAWRQLAHVSYRLGDNLGEIHAFIERAQLAEAPFDDISNTANRLNSLLRDHDLGVERDEKRILAKRLLDVLENRQTEATPDDFSRMGWLALHLGQEGKAQAFVREGLRIDPDNYHCQKLGLKLGVSGTPHHLDV